MHELHDLYRMLDQRVALRQEYNRILQTYAKEAAEALPCCLRFCPGSICCPSMPHLWHAYRQCRPCRGRQHRVRKTKTIMKKTSQHCDHDMRHKEEGEADDEHERKKKVPRDSSWTSIVIEDDDTSCIVNDYSPDFSGAKDVQQLMMVMTAQDRNRVSTIAAALASFPKHILHVYTEHRQGTGAAFVVFQNVCVYLRVCRDRSISIYRWRDR